MRIGLLNNLRAGRNDAQVNRLLGFLRRHPEVVHVETNSADIVPEALADLARQEVDLLVVNGGDGTLQSTLTEILENQAFDGRVPLIAPLRGGRTNMSGSDIGCDPNAVRGLAALLEDVARGDIEHRIAPRQVLRVGYGMNRRAVHGMFFGLGIIHRAIGIEHQNFNTGTGRLIQGVASSTIVTAGLLARAAMGDRSGVLAPDKLQVIIDGEHQECGEYFLMIMSTLRRLFSGMHPFWGEGPGGIRYTHMAGDAYRLNRSLVGIVRGKPASYVTEKNGYVSRNADRIEISMDCGFVVDGELFAPEAGHRVEVTGDRTIQFVRT